MTFFTVQNRAGYKRPFFVLRDGVPYGRARFSTQNEADREAASLNRMEAQREATKAAIVKGRCPCCGSGLRRNLALSGWWQCEQYGAEGFRKDSSRPACNWQGFTE